MPNVIKNPRIKSFEKLQERRRRAQEFIEKRRRQREEEASEMNPYRLQEIMTAPPAERILKLYEGARHFLLKAIDAIEQGDVSARYNANQRAANIIVHLRDILELEKGGEIAENLNRLYGFCLDRLVDTDLKNDAQAPKDVIDVLAPMEASWRELATKGPEQAASLLSGQNAAPASPDTNSPDHAAPQFSASV